MSRHWYVLTSDAMYQDLLRTLGPRAFRRHLADKAVANAARDWWLDYQRRALESLLTSMQVARAT